MKTHFANAFYGVLDYLMYPAGMLLAAPLVLRAIGAERYGIWMVACTVAMVGGIFASGMGDANIRAVAARHGAADGAGVIRTVENTLGVHLVIGAGFAALAYALAPWMAMRTAGLGSPLYADCVWSLRLASVLVVLRAIETVWISTLRALQLYGEALRVSAACRLLTLGGAVAVALASKSVTAMLAVATLVSVAGVCVQMRQVKRLLGTRILKPRLERAAVVSLLSFGVFTWVQAVAGLLLGQFDRLLAGLMFDAAAVPMYAICAQLTQPIYGIAAAGSHFLFPYLASRGQESEARGGTWIALIANLVFVSAAGLVLMEWGSSLLRMIAGANVAADGEAVLRTMALASILAGLSVTGTYAMLAVGAARAVAALAVAGCALTLAAVPLLTRRYGVLGLADARLLYGAVALLIYIPALARMKASAATTRHTDPSWEDA